MKHSFRKLCISACVIFAATALAAACSSSDGTATEGPGIGDSAMLAPTDFPSVGVCATGSTDLSDATLLADLAAFTEFTFVHLPYTSDADIPFICGREGTWDPSDPNAFAAFTADIPVTTTMTNFIQGAMGNVLICNTGFAFADPNTAGLHDATTYHGEVFFETGGRIHRARMRFTVSGTDADKTLADLGITAADLKLQDRNENELATIADVQALIAANPASISVQLVSNSTVHITALGRMICWELVTTIP